MAPRLTVLGAGVQREGTGGQAGDKDPIDGGRDRAGAGVRLGWRVRRGRKPGGGVAEGRGHGK